MNILPSLLLNNDALDAELEAFCASDPEYQEVRRQFDEMADEIARQVGFDAYDAFERRLSAYLFRTADLYYLFGLGLRQEFLQAIGG